MVLMVNGFRSFCPSAKLSKDKKEGLGENSKTMMDFLCMWQVEIEYNYDYREDFHVFLLIKFVQIPDITCMVISKFDTLTIELESIPNLTRQYISVGLTWHPPFWGWQGWCLPWTQTGGPVPRTGGRSCGAHKGWPGWRITACPGPSLEPTEQQNRVRQRAKYSRTESGKGAKYFRTGSDKGHSVPKTASQCTCLMVL